MALGHRYQDCNLINDQQKYLQNLTLECIEELETQSHVDLGNCGLMNKLDNNFHKSHAYVQVRRTC